MFKRFAPFFKGPTDAEFDQRLRELTQKTPCPVIWLFGKTQSGKTSIVKFLTGADEAEIGQGFKPCTRFARRYDFPNSETPLLRLLDTRGLEEPGYDPSEELTAFQHEAHVMVVTIRLLDFASEQLIAQLKTIRRAQPQRPILLAITCLHEAYPQEQHPDVYPYVPGQPIPLISNDPVTRSLHRHLHEFQGLYDAVVPIDLTPITERFLQPHYGGQYFQEVLLSLLPAAYRQSLIMLKEATRSLQGLYMQKAMPHIVAYSSLAATAGAFPIPWLDLLVLPGIQARMVHRLAQLYGQPMDGKRFMELAGTLGMGLVFRQALREVMKFIPFIGSAAGALLAGSSTFALGKAFCYYYSAIHQGHVPQADKLKQYYQDQLKAAETLWKKRT